MKKVFLIAAVIAMTFASCGNKTQGNDSAADSDSVATEQVSNAEAPAADNAALTEDTKTALTQLTTDLQNAVNAKDSKAAATTLASIQNKYKELLEQGKLEEAKAYGSAIKVFVNKNADNLKNIASGNTTVVDLVNGIANLPTSAETTAEQAKAALNSDATTAKALVEAGKAAAENSAKNAANQAVSDAKNAANKAASDAKAAATNKINSEVQKANAKVDAAKAKAEAKAAADKAKADAAKQKAADALNKAANTKLKDLVK